MDEQDVRLFEQLRGMLHCACGRKMDVACTTVEATGIHGEQRVGTAYRCWPCQARALGGWLIGGEGWVLERAS